MAEFAVAVTGALRLRRSGTLPSNGNRFSWLPIDVPPHLPSPETLSPGEEAVLSKEERGKSRGARIDFARGGK